ncbi:MAG: hypothetical protein ACREEM_40245 [Blastocatellia bacterium]
MFGETNTELPFGIVMILLFAGIGCYLIRFTQNHRQTLQWQTRLFLIAIGVRFLFSIITYEFGLVKVLGDEDGSGWQMGIFYSNQWTRKGLSILDLPVALSDAFFEHHRGYGYLTGALFFVTGFPGRMPAAAINCFSGAVTAIVAYRVARSLFSNWSAVRVGWAVCFFPSMIIWSCQTVKEPVVIMLEMVALYACVQLKLTGFSIRYAVLCASAIFLLLPFRFYAAYLAAGAAMIALVIPQIGKRVKFSVHSGLLVVALVVPLALSSGILARSQADIEAFDIERMQKFRGDIANGSGSGVQDNFDIRTRGGLIVGTAVGAAHLLLAPFPWQLGGASMRMLGTLPEVVVWWWLVAAGLIPGLWYAIKNRFGEMQPYLFFMLGLGLLYSMMFGNVGLIVRQRAQLLPMLLVFAMVGLEQREIKKLLKRRPRAGAPVMAQPRQARAS